MRCTGGYKRVRSRFGGTVRRCRKFGGGKRPRGRSSYRKRGKRPFNKGKRCVAWGSAIRNGRRVRVCRSYGSRSGWRSPRAAYAGEVRTPKRFRLAASAGPTAYGSGLFGLEGLGRMLLPMSGARSTRFRGRYYR